VNVKAVTRRLEPVKNVSSPTGWRDRIVVHPAADLFPMMSDDELKVLGADIKANGLKAPVIMYDDGTGGQQLLDGRNRFAAAVMVGVVPGAHVVSANATDPQLRCDDPYAYVISANIHRRHLTAEQRIELVAKLVKAQPTKSDRQIAKQASVSPTTAGKVRRDLEAKGDVSTVDTRTDTKGRQQPVHKPKAASSGKSKPKPVSSPPIVPSANPAKSSKPSVNTAPRLNSLSWSDATPDSRRKFIDAVGVIALWQAMTEEQQNRLINHINALQDAADVAKTENAHCP
jgi:hypothetical protein